MYRTTLEGRFVRLEPLTTWHTDDLFDASVGQDDRFTYLFEYAPVTRDELRSWIESKQDLSDPVFYAVVDQETGRAEGRQSLMRIDEPNRVVELGNIYWGPAISRRPHTSNTWLCPLLGCGLRIACVWSAGNCWSPINIA